MKKEIIVRNSIQKKIFQMLSKSRARLALFVFSTIVIALFIVAALLQNKGTFTVSTPRYDMIRYGFILSDTIGFERPRHELRAAPVIDMWNISETQLPSNLEKTDSSHNGDNYFAYTFYGKNDGIHDFTYTSSLIINEVRLNVDEALRVRLYINDVPTKYAKIRSDGSNLPEPDTVAFFNSTVVVHLPERRLNVNQVDKYTVVLWLEGDDPDCVDAILGGFVKMAMGFKIFPVKDDGKGLV